MEKVGYGPGNFGAACGTGSFGAEADCGIGAVTNGAIPTGAPPWRAAGPEVEIPAASQITHRSIVNPPAARRPLARQ